MLYLKESSCESFRWQSARSGCRQLSGQQVVRGVGLSTRKSTLKRYSVTCKCGNKMRVRSRHFGRMCRCTVCEFPIYVTFNNVTPPVHPSDREVLHHYDADSIPLIWNKGDLLMEMYDVREELGRGGMGVVHRVHHRGWGIDVAVKSPKKRLVRERGWVDTFEHECETWTNLPPHPNTVVCYCVRRLGDIPRVFVELVEGQDLGRIIRDKSLYEGDSDTVVHRILDIAIQVARGLHHAHENGVVHQDVKPRNMLVAASGDVKVTDFGLARVGVAENQGPSSGKLLRWGPLGGTPVYTSPDYKRLNEVTAQSDIWSLALSIIEMFSGEVFWQDGIEARNVMETLLAHGARYDVIPVIPPSLLPVLAQCFEEAPEDRPKSMLEMARMLEAAHERELGRPYFRSLPAIQVQKHDLMNNRAVSLAELGQRHEAEVIWTEIRGAEPTHIEARYNLALHQWRHGQISDNDVVAKLYRLCALHEGPWLPKYLLARVLVERGDATTACKILNNLTKKVRRDREVAFGIAISHEWTTKDKLPVWKARAHSTALTAVNVSYDGQWVLSGCAGGKVRLWERSSSAVFKTMAGHDGMVHALSIRACEKVCLSAGADGFVRMWSAGDASCIGELAGHEGPVLSMSVDEPKNTVITGGADGTIRHWDLTNRSCIRVIDTRDSAVLNLAISKNGLYALTGHESGMLRVWDLKTGEYLKCLSQNKGAVLAMDVSHSRPYVATSSGTKVKVWNLGRGEIIRTLDGHRTAVVGLRIDNSNRFVVSASSQGTMKIWNLETGQCVRSLRGTAPLALSQNGRYCVTGDPSGTLHCWQLYLDYTPPIAPYMICRNFIENGSISSSDI